MTDERVMRQMEEQLGELLAEHVQRIHDREKVFVFGQYYGRERLIPDGMAVSWAFERGDLNYMKYGDYLNSIDTTKMAVH